MFGLLNHSFSTYLLGTYSLPITMKGIWKESDHGNNPNPYVPILA